MQAALPKALPALMGCPGGSWLVGTGLQAARPALAPLCGTLQAVLLLFSLDMLTFLRDHKYLNTIVQSAGHLFPPNSAQTVVKFSVDLKDHLP